METAIDNSSGTVFVRHVSFENETPLCDGRDALKALTSLLQNCTGTDISAQHLGCLVELISKRLDDVSIGERVPVSSVPSVSPISK